MILHLKNQSNNLAPSSGVSQPSTSAGSFAQPSTSNECIPANIARQRIGGNLSINEHKRLFGYGNTGNGSIGKGKGKATTKRGSGRI